MAAQFEVILILSDITLQLNISTKIGIVVIGRNEGERLKRSVQSILGQTKTVVYVDSDSSDGSVAYAKENSTLVIKLDPKTLLL